MNPETLKRVQAWCLVLFCLPAGLAAQISPGKLSAPHSELDENTECSKCHDAREGITASLCLECHQLLNERIELGLGLHSRPDYLACDRCHIEHSGPSFDLIYWGEAGEESFDHDQAGWPLEGAHTKQRCRQCHEPTSISDPQPLLMQEKDLSRTFLGLTTRCLSCHEDEHRAQFTTDGCLSCHATASWVPVETFDHAATQFQLSGEHSGVECAACHPVLDDPAADDTFTQYTGLAFGQCSACHQDPHRGGFGSGCDQCHSTAGWTAVGDGTLDHNRTRFPLTGKHRSTQCRSCHGPSEQHQTAVFTGLAFAQCSDCHADPHEGRLGPSCEDCHSTAAWSAYDAGRFDHRRTRFPLVGAHQAATCEACHSTDGSFTVADYDDCATCHTDEHVGQFLDRTDTGACESCHSVERFVPSTFEVEDHQQLDYPLVGAHLAIPCVSCHQPIALDRIPSLSPAFLDDASGPSEAIQFRFDSSRCIQCHEDPHQGEVDRWVSETGCETCHSPESWASSVFLHGKTTYPLRGRHQQVVCIDCHPTVDQGAPRERVQMAGIPTLCSECHQTAHGRQFDVNGRPSECERCHFEEGWEVLLFVHDRDTEFALEGAHARTDCAACHLTDGSFGPGIVTYVSVPTACEACHDAAVVEPQSPDQKDVLGGRGDSNLAG